MDGISIKPLLSPR